jgi:hypothetical protein
MLHAFYTGGGVPAAFEAKGIPFIGFGGKLIEG